VKRNDDIQCLRGLAILLVMLQHFRGRLPTPRAYSDLFDHVAFWPGVDIFFAISGFLIYHSFGHDLANNRPMQAARIFWRRRIYRLAPAALLWVTLSVPLAEFAIHVANASASRAALGAIAAFAGISNVFWASCLPGHVTVCGNPDFNSVTWSLSLEWQLYGALSIGMMCFGRRRAVALLLAMGIGMSFLPAPLFSLPWSFRVLPFALGASLAHLSVGRSLAIPSPPINALLCLGGAMLAVVAPVAFADPLVIPLIALGAACCLLSALHGTSYSPLTISAPLRWIGERSYSIYLCHLPAYLLIRELMARSIGLEATAASVALAVSTAVVLIATFGHLSYRYIEIPLTRLGHSKAGAARAGLRAEAPGSTT